MTHHFIKSELVTKASQKLQDEVEKELQKAKANENPRKYITEIIKDNETSQ